MRDNTKPISFTEKQWKRISKLLKMLPGETDLLVSLDEQAQDMFPGRLGKQWFEGRIYFEKKPSQQIKAYNSVQKSWDGRYRMVAERFEIVGAGTFAFNHCRDTITQWLPTRSAAIRQAQKVADNPLEYFDVPGATQKKPTRP